MATPYGAIIYWRIAQKLLKRVWVYKIPAQSAGIRPHLKIFLHIFRMKSDGRRIQASRQKPNVLSIRRRGAPICDRGIMRTGEGKIPLKQGHVTVL